MRRLLALCALLLFLAPVTASAQLAPPNPSWGGTGLIPRSPLSKPLPSALEIPDVLQHYLQGAPPSYDLSALSGGIYNQGQTPRCASYSLATIKSYAEREEHSAWYGFNPDTLFFEGGGSDATGGSMDRMEQVAVSSGILRTDTGTRYRNASFAEVPSVPGLFEETIKAAVSAGKPVQLAVLLPSNFGWSSSGAVTSGYHALAIVGYDTFWAVCQNSWGPNWGNHGFCRLPWSYLLANNFQQGYVYGLVPTDAPDSAPAPAPSPTPAPTDAVSQVLVLVNQARSAAGLRPLAIDSRLAASAQGYAALLNTGIPFSHTGPDGSTPFSRMRAAGYPGGTMGENIARGFYSAADVMTAWMNSAGHRSNILYPAFDAIGIGIAGRSWVQDFGAGGGTPAPTPTPIPPPTPVPTPTPTPPPVPVPGQLAVQVSAFAYLRSTRLTITTTGGAGESGPVTLTIAGVWVPLPPQAATLGVPRSLYVSAPAGSTITVTAQTPDGRTGSGSAKVAW